MEFKEAPLGRRFCQRSFAYSEQACASISIKTPAGRRKGVVLQLRSQVVKPLRKFSWNLRCTSTTWKLPIQLLAVLALAFFSIRDSRAQTTTSGGLTGVITDPSAAVVPDVDVEIRDNAKGTTASAKTDREGLYQFFFLAPGRYTLTVTRDGFRIESRAVSVLLGPPVTVNVTLEIARKSTTVKVTGEAPLIQAENERGAPQARCLHHRV